MGWICYDVVFEKSDNWKQTALDINFRNLCIRYLPLCETLGIRGGIGAPWSPGTTIEEALVELVRLLVTFRQ
jgi:hypothetical protein